MSSLTDFFSSGGYPFGGTLNVTTFTSAITITPPTGKFLRIFALYQAVQAQTSGAYLDIDLRWGSRTICVNKRLEDYSPAGSNLAQQTFLDLYVATIGAGSVGYYPPFITGKVDEAFVITNVTRNGTPVGICGYEVLEL